MAVKSITHPTTGKTLFFGAKRPVAKCPRLKLENYTMKSLPDPPTSCNYVTAAASALAQMYGNDTVGDCVIAEILHQLGVATGNAGDEAVFTNTEAIGLYSAITGYVPGDPSTDNGTVPQDALNYMMKPGFSVPGYDNFTYSGWAAVNSRNLQEVRQAIYLFGGVMFTVELPDAWIATPPEPGFVWGINGPPDPENGHAFLACGYENDDGFIADTWGMLGTVTNGATKTYFNGEDGGDVFVALTPSIINAAKQKAPTGFDFSQLEADLSSFGVN
jgi:hypothetical protein